MIVVLTFDKMHLIVKIVKKKFVDNVQKDINTLYNIMKKLLKFIKMIIILL